ncbi:putative smn family protein smn1 protein [Phialemonium atrogriseum]|uniref:Smn family protein smn1 protein n=1 Tax=Phialemonium atrogriseum TaxID=1093897 RepID=A0AAJ0CAN5_9PEZI|nr:putative smn family protein smn1 protein [Phialemonium atrogriseum]KAK1772637.1 putative smn family protein smn1 protein [Phialemonium atrogriseum]
MEPRRDELTHDDIWDDSALIDSWNDALEEYKKYHSIHAKGGAAVDDILAQAKTRKNAKPETGDGSQPMEEGEVDQADETPKNGQGTDVHEDRAPTAVQGGHTTNAGPSNLGPQTILGSVGDEGLRKLLMSWYYAGYYTGLYEGQQQQQAKEEGQ